MRVGLLTTTICFLIALGFPFASLAGPAPDTDGDGVPDVIDNCSALSNTAQCDADSDGYGNGCDADMAPQDGSVSTADIPPFKVALTAGLGTPPIEDMNCDGSISTADIPPFKAALTTGFGPSGLSCADPQIGVTGVGSCP